jgi:hypothetical protein
LLHPHALLTALRMPYLRLVEPWERYICKKKKAPLKRKIHLLHYACHTCA